MSKLLKGTVVSTKMQNTVVVAVERKKRHSLYEKVIRRTKRFKARDGVGVSLGDKVVIEECRPFSKEVHFKVKEVINKEN